ncbi:DNA polymerase Y family protein [Asticcacaulis sp. LKC15W]|uniref:DNA-directed DNA polymerase n=1 Tax=Asticcacaulis machinosus TaxID=2984211 RepID=A0ABT5HG06_9CAUL|nr:DNA polymerase Y family protein [Asticcacaulis machinosus]
MTAVDDLAQKIGVRPGMAIVKAQALFSDLVLMDADPREDAQALERLALWALRLSPVVAADPPDGLVIDTTGADHLHGGEANMIETVTRRLSETGITAVPTLADTWGAAHALARFGRSVSPITPPGETAQVLLDLPVASLRLSPALVDSLRGLGFERISDLASQPRAPLTLRFGPELGRRLDQAFGREREPIKAAVEAKTIRVERVFAEPIGAPETIRRYALKLIVQLCDALEVAGLGVRTADLLCQRVDNRVESVRIGTARPLRDVKQLTRLLGDKLDTVDPGFGIEVMSLAATLTEPLGARQLHSSLIGPDTPDVGSLVDILANRLGENTIERPCPAASDLPERSVQWISPMSAVKTPWAHDWKRPTRLLPRPEAIEVLALLPDSPPRTFKWRGIRRRVMQADGPERVFGEWWKRDPELESIRDYYYLVDETGKRYWVFRMGDGEFDATGDQSWYMHGLFA